jgi:hypothetical protein
MAKDATYVELTGSQAGKPSAGAPEPDSNVRPTTELQATGFSPEPGEVREVDDEEKGEMQASRAARFSPLGSRLPSRAKRPHDSLADERSGEREQGCGTGFGTGHALPDLFERRGIANIRSNKRPRISDHDEEGLPYYVDTERRQPLRKPTPKATRIQRWQSEVQMARSPDEEVGSDEFGQKMMELAAVKHGKAGRSGGADIEGLVPLVDLAQGEGTEGQLANIIAIKAEEAEDQNMMVIRERGLNQRQDSPPPVAEMSSSESDCTSPKTTPPRTPLKREDRSSPFDTVDITARPSGVRCFGTVVKESEFEDITPMLNALEEADDFLARLASSLEAELNPSSVNGIQGSEGDHIDFADPLGRTVLD